ncbi:hypothetical protein BU14_0484s0009 [Porphyra umbilicalis]|uniref:fructokinase n=1 Tax=Porphyra umbilicalis TaxID=2786 RepID=A0A1X6NTP7_PORUM|nr:hypothetical protein BU14_0484s0009 [Porphyra umbilicalis]|eukprot:OSX71982.1 hypothetical protein BU14_0484s0009 [Porphyra umbilicalis]
MARLSAPTAVVDRLDVPTRSPAETLPVLAVWIRARATAGGSTSGNLSAAAIARGGGGDDDDVDLPLRAIGVASFGPLGVDAASPVYGTILNTPKVAWRGVDVLAPFRGFGVPLGLDTDVNAPAMAELRYGGHGPATNIAYITVGTGIGVGAVVNGSPLHGLLHPEAGHIYAPPAPGDTYGGCLTTHPRGVESMACARALADRVGGPAMAVAKLADVPDDHAVWAVAAHYLGHLVLSLVYILSPHVVVLSGGVSQRAGLLEGVQSALVDANAGYLAVSALTEAGVGRYVVRSRFGNAAGVVGALEVGRRALDQEGGLL